MVLLSAIKIVPQRNAFIVERLGKYFATLTPGLHFLIPFIDRVRYRHSLKEQALDVNPQMCITKDNVSVEVDGVLYFQVVDPNKASYGIEDYKFASIQIAQTTMRSVVGRLELDKTFEERETINASIVDAVDKASEPWGVKITRYEVKNITPPQRIRDAMEKQMRAKREKRAIIAESGADARTAHDAPRLAGERLSQTIGDLDTEIAEATCCRDGARFDLAEAHRERVDTDISHGMVFAVADGEHLGLGGLILVSRNDNHIIPHTQRRSIGIAFKAEAPIVPSILAVYIKATEGFTAY